MDDSKLHIVAVTGVIEKNGKYLIVKRSNNEIAFPGKWTIPGGKVERGHSIHQTLKREIREEVGLEVGDKINFIGDDEFTRPDSFHVVGLTFLCKYKSGEVKLCKDLTDYRWIDLNELDNYDLIEGVKNKIKSLQKVKRGVAQLA